MEMQSKSRVELRLKVKILYKMSNWAKDSGWSRKKNGLIMLGHHRLGSSVCCHWTAENVDHISHILEFGDKIYLDSLQEELTPDTETLPIKHLPFAVRWIAESSKARFLLTHGHSVRVSPQSTSGRLNKDCVTKS